MKTRRSPSPARVSLRVARETDIEMLYALDQECFSHEVAYTRADLHRYISSSEADCIVAETRTRAKDGRRLVAGFIVVNSENPRGHIVTIDVLGSCRQTGIGSALLRRAEMRLKQRGVTEVSLETATSNEAAIAFWKKHGYRTFGRIAKYYPYDSDAFVMSKTFAVRALEKKGKKNRSEEN